MSSIAVFAQRRSHKFIPELGISTAWKFSSRSIFGTQAALLKSTGTPLKGIDSATPSPKPEKIFHSIMKAPTNIWNYH